MLTAVWVAVVAFVVGAGVAVYVMLKAARLMSETSAAVAGLRERGDLLIGRANAAIDQAGEQIARTETVTASMEGVTAAMAQMTGHLAATAPALPAPGEGTSGPLTWAAALVYGVRWALGARRPGRDTPWPAGQGHAGHGRAGQGNAGARGRWPGRADRPRGRAAQPDRQAGRKTATTAGRKADAPAGRKTDAPAGRKTDAPDGGRAAVPASRRAAALASRGVAALASRSNGTPR
jgi:hypothetical protein